MGILDDIKEYISGNPSVKKLSDDPQLTSEILLLVRMMFADGELTSDELKFFKLMCSTVFGIREEDVPEVLAYLKEIGYETNARQAAGSFEDMDHNRKKEVLVHVVSMARADNRLVKEEVEMLARIARVLNVSVDELKTIV